MRYDHMVKVNGVYYQSGEDVPESKNTAVGGFPLPFSDEEDGEDKKRIYTKTEISRMSTAELKNLAAKEGIENAMTTSGNELKKILFEHFNL